jgi:hypothetical protein
MVFRFCKLRFAAGYFQAARNLEQGLFKSRWCGEYFNFFNCRGGKMLFRCDCSFFFTERAAFSARIFVTFLELFTAGGEQRGVYFYLVDAPFLERTTNKIAATAADHTRKIITHAEYLPS